MPSTHFLVAEVNLNERDDHRSYGSFAHLKPPKSSQLKTLKRNAIDLVEEKFDVYAHWSCNGNIALF